MKKLFLGFAFLLSLVTFAQEQSGPPPILIGGSQWQSYTFYTCDSNGVEITNPLNRKYKKYDLEILVPISTEPWHVVSLYRDRVKDQICQFGEITEFHSDLIKILKITKSPLSLTINDVPFSEVKK
ncbi:hypothetical protein [Myroides odoratus]|uniref:hypothetical protein n=1 Tax=Myroides odoratus TaxID=256 RepID=UPI0039B119AB